MKKKILVCGSAGFIGSNIIRYITYGTKEFSIISVDKLPSEKDCKRLYINKKQKFYIGNLLDTDFVKSLINLEKPDLILNTINCNTENNYYDKLDCLKIYAHLLNYNIPIIQIIPSSYTDDYGIWDGIRNRNRTNNIIIEIPNCFGGRQKIRKLHPNSILINYISKLDIDNTYFVHNKKAPWVFINDVSSFIWFSIEMGLKGYIKMPESGYLSLEDIIRAISDIFNKEVQISNNLGILDVVDYEYKGDNIDKFQIDNTIEDSLIHTIKWYSVNKWSLV